MKKIAIIPARAGSKRFPRKNITDFFGKPIISYTINAALNANIFEKVIVSTEDSEIAYIAEEYGAEISTRPDELASDYATVVDVCLYELDKEEQNGNVYDILCCLYATAPLRNEKDIVKTVQMVQSKDCDFANAVTDFHFPAYQALKSNESGFLEAMWPDSISKPSHDMPRLLVDNGSTYVSLVSEFRKVKSFYGKRHKGYIMPRIRSVDLDYPEDLEIAKYFYNRVGI
ncbi:MAG: N-acylneuraminate cytidylyltransferase [Candidatus Magnetoglobus multicellularis str. Araruama]|uniref:N-acylneuraminate cytidylyltransferase n=1 Tax=Candidatus Magnetoglobus multicellularis str. Araruama TaxID=890399 RepID=A0A1V1NVA1_9BACT|nr:MAG: N-acylneuraminate cytidylyltransferase [Candidatus Magnetoglobus multicellularis str. Araruama]